MAGASAELPLEKLPQWANGLAADVAGMDLAVPLRTSAVLVAGASRQYFQQSRGPDGAEWKELKRRRSGKRHKGSSAKPLLDKGLLAASVSARGSVRVEGGMLVQSTNIPYASFHQKGAPRAKIPARPFLGFSPSLLETIENIIADYVADKLAGG